MENSQPWYQPEEMPGGGADACQEASSPFASELWKVVNPPTSARLDLAGQEATEVLLPSLRVQDSGSRKRKEPVIQWNVCSIPLSNENKTCLDGSSSMQPGGQVGNFGNVVINDGASGSAGSALYPMVINNLTTALDSHTQRPFEGHHSYSFPTVTSAPPISSNAMIPIAGIQGVGSSSTAPAKGTSAPKKPRKVSKSITGIRNFFAFIGTNVSDSPPRSTAPVAGTVRGDREIDGSSRNQGSTGMLQLNTDALVIGCSARHNDTVAVGNGSNWSGHGASAMPHIAAALGGYNWSSTMFTMQQNAIPHNTGYSVAFNADKGGSSSNPNHAMSAMHQAAIPRNTACNDNEGGGSGHRNLTNFAFQLNATQCNTAGYSSTNNYRQDAGVGSNLSSADIARQLNAHPLDKAFGYAKMCKDNQIGGSSRNLTSTNMVAQQTAVPQNTGGYLPMHNNHGAITNHSSTDNAMELNAIPHGLLYETSYWNGDFGEGDSF